jgi:hypothetical protein
VSAVVPPPGAREDRPWSDVPRNELAEVIAYLVIEKVRGALVPAKRIREKEVPGQPPRGMDLLGLQTNPTLRLLITEVKASEASQSPPSVVATGDDSLRGQLLKFIRRPERVLQELNWVYKHSASGNQLLVARAILHWVRRALPVTVVPLLVRSLDKHQPTDYGSFRDRPSEFAPARVQFEIVRVSIGISALAEQVYSRARSA